MPDSPSRRSVSEDFRGGDMIAFMGGCEIDLRDAGSGGEQQGAGNGHPGMVEHDG